MVTEGGSFPRRDPLDDVNEKERELINMGFPIVEAYSGRSDDRGMPICFCPYCDNKIYLPHERIKERVALIMECVEDEYVVIANPEACERLRRVGANVIEPPMVRITRGKITRTSRAQRQRDGARSIVKYIEGR
jgi:hypothetical protein